MTELTPTPAGFVVRVQPRSSDAAADAASLVAALAELPPGSDRVVLDLSDCATIDSGALGVLVRADRRLRSNGVAFSVVVRHPQLLERLRLGGLSRRLPLAPSLD